MLLVFFYVVSCLSFLSSLIQGQDLEAIEDIDFLRVVVCTFINAIDPTEINANTKSPYLQREFIIGYTKHSFIL